MRDRDHHVGGIVVVAVLVVSIIGVWVNVAGCTESTEPKPACSDETLSLALASSFHRELLDLAAECEVEVEYLGVLGARPRRGLQPVFEDTSWQIVRIDNQG